MHGKGSNTGCPYLLFYADKLECHVCFGAGPSCSRYHQRLCMSARMSSRKGTCARPCPWDYLASFSSSTCELALCGVCQNRASSRRVTWTGWRVSREREGEENSFPCCNKQPKKICDKIQASLAVTASSWKSHFCQQLQQSRQNWSLVSTPNLQNWGVCPNVWGLEKWRSIDWWKKKWRSIDWWRHPA